MKIDYTQAVAQFLEEMETAMKAFGPSSDTGKRLANLKAAAENGMEKAREEHEKHKLLHDWEENHKNSPQNLAEAVIQRESFKRAYEQVYGPGSY